MRYLIILLILCSCSSPPELRELELSFEKTLGIRGDARLCEPDVSCFKDIDFRGLKITNLSDRPLPAVELTFEVVTPLNEVYFGGCGEVVTIQPGDTRKCRTKLSFDRYIPNYDLFPMQVTLVDYGLTVSIFD